MKRLIIALVVFGLPFLAYSQEEFLTGVHGSLNVFSATTSGTSDFQIQGSWVSQEGYPAANIKARVGEIEGDIVWSVDAHRYEIITIVSIVGGIVTLDIRDIDLLGSFSTGIGCIIDEKIGYPGWTSGVGEILNSKIIRHFNIELKRIVSASGNKVTQIAHGFALPTEGFIPVYLDEGDGLWKAAIADSIVTTAESVITDIISVDDFILQSGGVIDVGGHGLVTGKTYYVSESVPGDIQTIEPSISQPIAIPLNSFQILIFDNIVSSDKVVLSGTHNTGTSNLDFVVGGQGSSFSIDVSTIGVSVNPAIVTLADVGAFFTTDNVEAALQELGASIHSPVTIGTESGINLNLTGQILDAELDVFGLTTGAPVDGASDFIPIYDASIPAHRKVTPNTIALGVDPVNLALADVGAFFTTDNVEAALQELGASIHSPVTIGTESGINLNLTGQILDAELDVNSLPTESTIDGVNDFIPVYDASVTVMVKATPNSIASAIEPINLLLADVGAFFVTDNVEAALQEVGSFASSGGGIYSGSGSLASGSTIVSMLGDNTESIIFQADGGASNGTLSIKHDSDNESLASPSGAAINGAFLEFDYPSGGGDCFMGVVDDGEFEIASAGSLQLNGGGGVFSSGNGAFTVVNTNGLKNKTWSTGSRPSLSAGNSGSVGYNNTIHAIDLWDGTSWQSVGSYWMDTLRTVDFAMTSFGVYIPVDCTGGSVEIDLPPGTPSRGDRFKIADVALSVSDPGTVVTVDFTSAGDNVSSSTGNYIMNTTGGVVEFIYFDSTIGWVPDL